MNAANSTQTEPDKTTPATPSAPEKPEQRTPLQPQYNPMAEILERHENAVNRLKRGK